MTRESGDRFGWLEGFSREHLALGSAVVGALLGVCIAAAVVALWTNDRGAEWMTAIGTWLLVAGTAALAYVGIGQIRVVANQQRKWTTLQACDRYDTDPIINNAQDVIWRHTHGGPQLEADVEQAALRLLNFFDAIAIGVKQRLYRDDLAKAHMGHVIPRLIDRLRSMQIDSVQNLLEAMPTYHKCLVEMLDRWGQNPVDDAYHPIVD